MSSGLTHPPGIDEFRFVGMQISERRMQNDKFVCGVRRTCKQNNLRKSQVIFITTRGRKAAR